MEQDVVAKEGSILRQIAELYAMPIKTLKQRYGDILPPGDVSCNKDYLIKRIAYKLQEDAFGGLPPDAQNKLEELKVTLNPIKTLGAHKSRLPMPGTIITKSYKGQEVAVKVLAEGFEYNGKTYKSLSRIAKEISGVHQSGFVFFGL